jgi:hypothetical protein
VSGCETGHVEEMAPTARFSHDTTFSAHSETAHWHLDAGGGSHPLHYERTLQVVSLTSPNLLETILPNKLQTMEDRSKEGLN